MHSERLIDLWVNPPPPLTRSLCFYHLRTQNHHVLLFTRTAGGLTDTESMEGNCA